MLKLDRVLKQIKEEIVEGRHGVAGDRFMTVRKFEERFGVSLTTAQKVVRRLKEEGLLVADSTNPALLGPERVPQRRPERSVRGPVRVLR